ncbi:SsrA-binding protein SmpB [Patescibacteria group bacterium]
MLIAKNRKALFNYEIVEKFLAGIELKGYEVKALREKKVNFEGAYISLLEGVPHLVNLHIGRYSNQSQEYNEQEARRPRKLLLLKPEIHKLQREISEKGKTAVPLAILLKNNIIKIELAVVKGKKKHQKKVLLKARQQKEDLEKQFKEKRF